MTVHLMTGEQRPDIDGWQTACGRWVQAEFASSGTLDVTCLACRGTWRFAHPEAWRYQFR